MKRSRPGECGERSAACIPPPAPRRSPRRAAFLSALALALASGIAIGLARPAAAQEPPPAPTDAAAPAGPDDPAGAAGATDVPPASADEPPPTPQSYELLGPPLFPFYDHYLRRSDRTEVLNVLYVYRSTSNPAGDASQLLFPFYYWERRIEPADRSLYLFPLLFFHRASTASSFNVALPLFYDYRTPRTSTQVLFPLWVRHADQESHTVSHHFPMPLARLRSSAPPDEPPETGFRFGIPWVVEVASFFRKAESETRTAFLSLFNFADEASSRIALFHRSSEKAGDDSRSTTTHLFPFLWMGSDAERDYQHVVPFVFRKRSANDSFLWVVPFYGHNESRGDRDLFLPIALSRFGSSENGDVRRDILWPLYQRRFGPQHSSLTTFPFFGYRWTPESRKWNVLLSVIYGNEHTFKTGKTAHEFLWPLGRIDVEPDGITGQRRLLPFYLDDFTETRRHRVSPLFYNYQSRSGSTVLYNFTFALPDYFGWGRPDDYFGFGFPLYWKSRAGRTGWDLFLPAYFSFFRTASWGVHVLPLVSYNSYPSERQLFIGGPAFVYRKFLDYEGATSGTHVSMPWPLVTVETRKDGYHYRLLPLFWTSRQGEDRDFLLFPLWYRQWGAATSQDYFFAAYGKYEHENLTRQFYGMGSYVRTRERGDAGEIVRSRDDILWSLISLQEDKKSSIRHQRVLPLAYWNTTSAEEDYRIVGPLYYGHRIEDNVNGRTHDLDLFLGNLLVSKEVRRHPRPDDPIAIDTGERRGPVVSREEGVLWPFLRQGEDLENGITSRWALPVYYDRESKDRRTIGVFPLAFVDRMSDRYTMSFFRYFYLFDTEKWRDGERWTVGQVLFDWMRDRDGDLVRWRFLYPLVENTLTPEGWSYQVTPLIQGSYRQDGGERQSSHSFYPILWSGSTKRETDAGVFETERSHFYVFPFFGVNRKQLRTQYDALIPFFHIERGLDSFKLQFRPFFFLRRDPAETSVRFWPLHNHEIGAAAGDWWVSRYLFLSKAFVQTNRWSYRLDPFFFRISKGPDSFGISSLFELLAYDRSGGPQPQTSFRALPFIYGRLDDRDSSFLSFPLFYSRNFGDEAIDHGVPWRFFYLFNHLRGANGERSMSLLWKLLEYHDNTRRPEYHEFRLLYALYQDIEDVNFTQRAMQPFFYYSSDETDPLYPEKTLFILPLLGYRYSQQGAHTAHYICWFIPIWWG